MCRERKRIMKTTLKNMLIIVLLVLSGTMQAAAVDYKGTYKGTRVQPTVGVATTVTAPTVGFQSTSAYSAQWQEEQEEPMLNADGTVNGDAYMSENHLPGRSVRKSPGTPGGTLDPNAQQPLGDGLIALMLCACAYLIVRATRKEEKIG